MAVKYLIISRLQLRRVIILQWTKVDNFRLIMKGSTIDPFYAFL